MRPRWRPTWHVRALTRAGVRVHAATAQLRVRCALLVLPDLLSCEVGVGAGIQRRVVSERKIEGVGTRRRASRPVSRPYTTMARGTQRINAPSAEQPMLKSSNEGDLEMPFDSWRELEPKIPLRRLILIRPWCVSLFPVSGEALGKRVAQGEARAIDACKGGAVCQQTVASGAGGSAGGWRAVLAKTGVQNWPGARAKPRILVSEHWLRHQRRVRLAARLFGPCAPVLCCSQARDARAALHLLTATHPAAEA